jgi:DNA-binding response OmpR family regulator
VTLSQLPRSASRPGSIIETGRLVIDLDTHVALVEDRPVALTEKEYGIIELLSLRKGTILTKEMFLDHLYGGMDEPETLRCGFYSEVYFFRKSHVRVPKR